MDGETNGGQEATQGAQDASRQQGQEQQETQQGQSQVDNASDFEKQIAERDEKIASLEAQVAEAAKNAETAEQLRGEIAELKAQSESDRIDFKLQLADVRNVKAARALLGDHGNDVDKLKEAEPWPFKATGKHAKGGSSGGSGTTGPPNAGAASDEGKAMFEERKAHMESEIAKMNRALDMLKFKCWYYEQVIQDGGEDRLKALIPDDLPEGIKETYRNAHAR